MQPNILLWGVITVIAVVVVDYARNFFRKGLKNLPGPGLARLSGLYRLSMVINGDSPQNYRRLHDRYGKLVRVAPNHVSISDSSEIPRVYGIGSKFLKVPAFSSLQGRS